MSLSDYAFAPLGFMKRRCTEFSSRIFPLFSAATLDPRYHFVFLTTFYQRTANQAGRLSLTTIDVSECVCCTFRSEHFDGFADHCKGIFFSLSYSYTSQYFFDAF